MNSFNYWIEKLNLQPHPEGGYFAEVYKSDEFINKENLPKRYSRPRAYSTSIYFLITSENFSSFHRIKSDETWHFYYGSAIKLHIIDEKGSYFIIKLGNNLDNEEVFQFTIKRGVWFAAEVINADSYSLIGCTVSPGFDYDDFELGKRKMLIKEYPEYELIIKKLTRD